MEKAYLFREESADLDGYIHQVTPQNSDQQNWIWKVRFITEHCENVPLG
jgi:hypothetical protein